MRRYILKIDIDLKMEGWVLNNFIDTRLVMLNYLGGRMKFRVSDFYIHDTQRGHHMYIHIISERELKPEVINWLQFLCGDDQSRVKINFERIKRGIKHWNKLFARVTYRRPKKYVKCPVCQYKFAIDYEREKKNEK